MSSRRDFLKLSALGTASFAVPGAYSSELTMTYNTGNPVPSKDARDLTDNAESLDIRMTSRVVRSTPDRLGIPRKTWHGIEQDFAEFLAASGFEPVHLTYQDGVALQVDRPTQLIDYSGSVYRVKMPASFPVVLTGTWATDSVRLVDVGDQSLRQSLAQAGGAQLVGHRTSTVADEIERLSESAKSARISLLNFGAACDGITDDSAAVSACIQHCVESGIRVVNFSGTVYMSAIPAHRQEVVFLGDGEFIGDGAYGIRWCSEDAPAFDPAGICSPGALLKASQRLSRVVLVGDSISTPSADTLDATSGFWSLLQEKIRRDNPGQSIDFFNRAIGGRVFSELANKPVGGGLPAWYADSGRTWLSYIEELKPDLVVVAMGMNGPANSNNIVSIKNIIDTIRGWEFAPDVVFVTTPMPSTQTDAAYWNEYSATNGQESRIRAAWAVRSVCNYYGVPVLDVNRACLALRDGYDPLGAQVKRLASPILQGGAFVAPIYTNRNWSAGFALPGRAAYATVGGLSFTVGGGASHAAFLTLSADNTLQVRLYSQLGAPYLTRTLTGQVVPDGPHKVHVSIKDNWLVVYLDGTSLPDIPAPMAIVHDSAAYVAKIGNYNASYTNGPLTGIDYFNYGVHPRLRPMITNQEMWGESTASSGLKLPWGGNGINHPTTVGARALYESVLNASNFGSLVGESQFKQVALNQGATTLKLIPAIRPTSTGGRQCFVFARCSEGTGQAFSSAWYRLIDHGNGKWHLSAPMMAITTGSVISHTLTVNVDTGELTLSNGLTGPSTPINRIAISYEINPGF